MSRSMPRTETSSRLQGFDSPGQADTHFDSPEPTVAALKGTCPAGHYQVTGHTTTGRRLSSTVVRTYRHIGTPIVVSPTPRIDAPKHGLVVRWKAVPGASSMHNQVERDSPHRALGVHLPRTVTTFLVPDGLLEAGTEYVVDVQAEHPSGNYTMSDVTFTTTP